MIINLFSKKCVHVKTTLEAIGKTQQTQMP